MPRTPKMPMPVPSGGDVGEMEALPLVGVSPEHECTESPTLTDAFFMLCEALEVHFEDNQSVLLHLDDMRGWMTNQNVQPSWGHAFQLLEQALGVSLGLSPR